MNWRLVTIRIFRGRGYGAGDNTVSVQVSMSTPVLWWMTSYDITNTISMTSVTYMQRNPAEGAVATPSSVELAILRLTIT